MAKTLQYLGRGDGTETTVQQSIQPGSVDCLDNVSIAGLIHYADCFVTAYKSGCFVADTEFSGTTLNIWLEKG